MDITSSFSAKISEHMEKRKQADAQPLEKKNYKKTGKVLLILGVCIELLGMGLLANEFVISASGVKTTGTIVEIKLTETTNEDRQAGYIPVFSFADQEGKAHTIESVIVSQFKDHEVGDQVPVIYHKDNPNKARVDNGFRWYGPIVAIFVGSANVVGGLLLGIFAKRQENTGV